MAAPEPGGARVLECSICLEVAREPVATRCGHVFCWPCLYRWAQSFHSKTTAPTCPVCKAEVSMDALIPLYAGDGASATPRPGDDAIPARPRADVTRPHPPPPPRAADHGGGGWADGPAGPSGDPRRTFRFGGRYGLVPGASIADDGDAGPPLTEDERKRVFVSRLYILLGLLIIFVLVFVW